MGQQTPVTRTNHGEVKVPGLTFYPHNEQRLPEPFVELSLDEWLFMKAHSDSGIPSAMSFEQLFLDYGLGRLMTNPTISWTPMGMIYYVPEPGAVVAPLIFPRRSPLPEEIMEITSIVEGETRYQYTVVAKDNDGLLREFTRDQLVIRSVFNGKGGWDGLSNMWSVVFEWYSDRGIATCHRYCRYEEWLQNLDWCQESEIEPPEPWRASFIPGKGNFVPQYKGRLDEYGFAYRWFRLGCQHKNVKHWSPQMFSQMYCCLDCGYTWGHDSSG